MLECLFNIFAVNGAQPAQLQIIDLNAVKEIFEARAAAVNLMGLTAHIDEKQSFHIHSPYIQNILGRLSVPGYVVVHKYDGRIGTICTKKLTNKIFELWHDSCKKAIYIDPTILLQDSFFRMYMTHSQ